MHIIVFCGVPGTGKSTIAEVVGRELQIPVFALDWVLGVLVPFHILTNENAWDVGFGMLTMLARRQLMLGQSVILDSPAYWESTREEWRRLAAEYNAGFRLLQTICSDDSLHRSRIDGRVRGIPGWHELTWEQVERGKSRLEPLSGDYCTLDAVNPLDENVRRALEYVDTL